MKLFKQHTGQSALSDKAADSIAKSILKTQRFFTSAMQSFTRGWKQKQQWIFLYIVCLVFGGLSVFAIVQPFRTKQAGVSIKPLSITVPKIIQKETNVFIITDKEFQRVQAYKQTHPNLLKERPGLYDSLSRVEQMYYSQQK